jgi:hypothetical protein
VTVVFPQADGRSTIIAGARPLDVPWMADAVVRLRADPALAAVASSDSAIDAPSDLAMFAVLARTDAGRPLALAARGNAAGHDGLLVLSLARAGSLSSAALLSSVARLRAPLVPLREMDTTRIADDSLRQWGRAPTAVASPGAGGNSQSDGRWFWVLAIILLAAETFVRRRVSAEPSSGQPA